MENRSIGHESRHESALTQHAAAIQEATTSEPSDTPLSGEELHRLIEFFRLLDQWDRKEVAQ